LASANGHNSVFFFASGLSAKADEIRHLPASKYLWKHQVCFAGGRRQNVHCKTSVGVSRQNEPPKDSVNIAGGFSRRIEKQKNTGALAPTSKLSIMGLKPLFVLLPFSRQLKLTGKHSKTRQNRLYTFQRDLCQACRSKRFNTFVFNSEAIQLGSTVRRSLNTSTGSVYHTERSRSAPQAGSP